MVVDGGNGCEGGGRDVAGDRSRRESGVFVGLGFTDLERHQDGVGAALDPNRGRPLLNGLHRILELVEPTLWESSPNSKNKL